VSTVIFILVIAAIAGMTYWNHRTASSAMEGVTFVVPHPPSVVADAIHRAHNQGSMAMLRGVVGGISVSPIGPTGFATNSRMGDSGEISISRDPSGSVVQARALSLHLGMPPRQLASGGSGIWGLSKLITHGLFKVFGITPSAAKMKRWQRGLEGRITRAIVKATSV
jgi:hypothetical protein